MDNIRGTDKQTGVCVRGSPLMEVELLPPLGSTPAPNQLQHAFSTFLCLRYRDNLRTTDKPHALQRERLVAIQNYQTSRSLK